MKYLSVTNRNEVAAKDAVKKGIEVATSASSKATHYHKAEDQAGAIKETVAILSAMGAELPFVVAAQPGVRGVFQQEVILQDLDRGSDGKTLILSGEDWTQVRYAATAVLIDKLGKESGLPYIMRMFEEARVRKINNTRTTWLILSTLLNMKKLEYAAVKYRAKFRTVLTHAWGAGNTKRLVDGIITHLSTGTLDAAGFQLQRDLIGRYLTHSVNIDLIEPIIAYVFGKAEPAFYSDTKFPVISNVMRAHVSIDGITNVPVEVLRGIISRPAHPQYATLWSTPEQRKETEKRLLEQVKTTTANQAMRESKRREELGVTVKAEADKVTDPMALVKSLMTSSLSGEARREALKQLTKIAENYAADLPYNTVGIIVDNSISMHGDSKESKDTPKAIATLMYEVIRASIARKGATPHVATVNGYTTDLARGLIEILMVCPRPDVVYVISDGYENAYDGALEDVAEAYWRNVVNFPIIHLSPIGAAEMGGTLRPISATGKIISLPANWKSFKVMMDENLIDTNFKGWLKREIEGLIVPLVGSRLLSA